MSDFTVEKLEVGPMGANCYIVTDKVTKNTFLIDPGGEPDRIKNVLKKNGLNTMIPYRKAWQSISVLILHLPKRRNQTILLCNAGELTLRASIIC